jgi:tetratricopeptide (TPR) repeat protein
MKHRLLVAAVIAACVQRTALAQAPVPAGLAAEGEGRWADAVRIYESALAREAARADLLIRLGDIYARLGDQTAVIRSLERAARVAPSNADVFFRLSQAYAAADQPSAAAAAIQRAVSIEPANAAYRRASAVLATWVGDYSRAQSDYRVVNQAAPDDTSVLLALARVSAWAGHTDAAVDAYRKYLNRSPDDADAWLELSTAESWRGNYAGALDTLAQYRTRFGATTAYATHAAAALARGGRPTAALQIIQPLLSRDPSNYDLNLTRTIAFTMQERPGAAFDALRTIRSLNASDAQTRTAAQIVRANLGSMLEPRATFYSDSDHMQVVRFSPDATVLLSSGTQLSGGYDRVLLDAPRASGLGRSDQGTAKYEQAWGGIGQRLGFLDVHARVGSATADSHAMTPYMVGARVRASDAFTFAIDHSHDFFVVSPRTVELGLQNRQDHVLARWRPAMTVEVAAEGVYQRISDGNVRWEATVTPRKSLARRERLNLDLGASAYVLGTSRNLPSGYYQPSRYENYALVAYPYFKIAENVGIGMSLAAGEQRERDRPFRFGGTASIEATVGIYRPWVLKISGAATNNQRVDSGAFSGYSGSVTLVRRF